MSERRARIVHEGRTRVEIDGVDITSFVRGVRWEHDSPSAVPTCTVDLAVYEADFITSTVIWAGLERIPTDILQEEIARREND